MDWISRPDRLPTSSDLNPSNHPTVDLHLYVITKLSICYTEAAPIPSGYVYRTLHDSRKLYYLHPANPPLDGCRAARYFYAVNGKSPVQRIACQRSIKQKTKKKRGDCTHLSLSLSFPKLKKGNHLSPESETSPSLLLQKGVKFTLRPDQHQDQRMRS